MGEGATCAKHRDRTPADAIANDDLEAASRAAQAELDRRRAYLHLIYLESRIAELRPVPGDPTYVERSSDFAKS